MAADPSDDDVNDTVLAAPYVLEYAYRRSTGPVIGRFLAGLRDGRILGSRTAGGEVIVPAAEYDPASGEACGELVEVGPAGVVEAWTREGDGTAWAMVRLDGADTAMLHRAEVPEDVLRAGLRVVARWNEARTGSIADLAGFVVEGGAAAPVAIPEGAPVTRIKTPVRLAYEVTAGETLSRFLAGVVEGRILGRRCPACAKVYVPPKGACPTCGVAFGDEVEVRDTGTVTSFCIVNVPFEGQTMKLPYTYGSILLDGSDIPLLHLIAGLDAAEVRMGLRVRAEWLPPGERRPTLESIRWFVPSGEPDAAYETYAEHQ